MIKEETSDKNNKEELVDQRGVISKKLADENIDNESLGVDHIGIEIISVAPSKLYSAINKLKSLGFNYLQCQGGYDEGPGKRLVSFYHLISLGDLDQIKEIQEIRVKVFLSRDSDLSIPSLYSIFKGSDWQERETYDMFGINFLNHPCPKRLLMPEDWRGWPLRKDYIQPDFYEMQDAY
ncbi:MAG: NAD(P)H-quinone oxidoreductase subunit J [Prochlorococcus sp. SP3034]|nr:NAD(P)H-quinone oxidoreductase subunit J [Prochlorococcus sp. SP3034]|tara:strand:- start:30411 stop:30947 length:537 start_codon:yes stop_codon:yes gene_type:complete